MASNRKIWKSKKAAQYIFIGILILVLVVVIYDKKKERTIAPQYMLNDKLSAAFEYTIRNDRTAPSPDASDFVKIYIPEDSRGKVSFKDANEVTISAFPGHRIVHLDLKGAPPKASYYAEFFPFLKKIGATGVLLEYEDMFPYKSIDVAANNAYSRDEIKKILDYANKSSLEVIPLIQTFGHLEFTLKLQKYKLLRESPQYPQAICPSKNESISLLYSMIDEILETHVGIKYLHIGCDEVYQLAQCNDCRELIHRKKWNSRDLFLNHVTTLASCSGWAMNKELVGHKICFYGPQALFSIESTSVCKVPIWYIEKKTEGRVKPLIWDDELRTMSIALLKTWNIGKLVEPVIWKYTADVEAHLTEDLWIKYSQVFSAVWFASAFKGARYPNAFSTYINFYFENHKSWMGLIYKYSDKIFFRGGFLTGWQRYDHFAVLCELLPVSIPSLALNLIYLSTDIKSLVELSVRTQRVCGCDANPVMATTLHGSCTFPGSCLYMAVTKLPQLIFALQREKDQSPYKGWMSGLNIKYSFSNPAHVEEATNNMLNIYSELNEVERELRQCMDNIYDNSTTAEWLYTYIKPLKEELQTAIEARDRILTKDVWPKRPIFT